MLLPTKFSGLLMNIAGDASSVASPAMASAVVTNTSTSATSCRAMSPVTGQQFAAWLPVLRRIITPVVCGTSLMLIARERRRDRAVSAVEAGEFRCQERPCSASRLRVVLLGTDPGRWRTAALPSCPEHWVHRTPRRHCATRPSCRVVAAFVRIGWPRGSYESARARQPGTTPPRSNTRVRRRVVSKPVIEHAEAQPREVNVAEVRKIAARDLAARLGGLVVRRVVADR